MSKGILPKSSAVTYLSTQKLDDIKLPDGWKWANGNIVPTVGNSGYQANYSVSDDVNYDWSKVDGYNAETHMVSRVLTLIVNASKPTDTSDGGNSQNSMSGEISKVEGSQNSVSDETSKVEGSQNSVNDETSEVEYSQNSVSDETSEVEYSQNSESNEVSDSGSIEENSQNTLTGSIVGEISTLMLIVTLATAVVSFGVVIGVILVRRYKFKFKK